MNTLIGSTDWMLRDHQRIKTVKAKRGRPSSHHRMNSIISVGSENLGYIPEDDTLTTQPTSPSRADVTDSDYSTLSPTHSSAEQNTDNPRRSSSTSSTKELMLDLSDLDISLSTDQFSFRSSRTKNFYEAFGTPRSQSQDFLYNPDDSFDTVSASCPLQDVRVPLRYSYPNISLPTQADRPVSQPSSSRSDRVSSGDKRKYIKRADMESSNPSQLFSQTLPLPMTSDLWSTNRSSESRLTQKRISKMRSGNSRVNYLTQLKLGETVRMHQEKKKRKRFNPKGTIHYGFKSDVDLANS